MSGVDNAGSPGQRRWMVAALVVLVLAVTTTPFTLAGLAIWAADGPWEFTGSGFRHWVFIKGSTVDRLGFVTAMEGPISYVVRLGEGTDPGETSAAYESRALPADILVAYAERCRKMGLAVRKQVVVADATEARLVCEGDRDAAGSDDVLVIAKHMAKASITQVRILAGPGLTLTYNF